MIAAGCGSPLAGRPDAERAGGGAPAATADAVTPETGRDVLVSPTPTGEAGLTGAAIDPLPSPTLDGGLPATWLGVTSSGELVVVETEGGAVVASFGALADPTQATAGERLPNAVDAAWRRPGSQEVFASVCCEPAGGNVIAVGPETSPEEQASAFAGFAAVPSPDGALVAVPQLVGLYVASPEAPGEGNVVSSTADLGAGAGAVAWLRDRRGLVWAPIAAPAEQTVEVIELDDENRPVEVRALPASDLHGITVATRADGAVLLAGCETETGDGIEPGGPCPHSRGVLVDPVAAEIVGELGLEPGAKLGGYDPGGSYVIYTDGEGNARWHGDGAGGVLGSGYRWATW
jgi:hypothetical protein